MSDPFEEVFSNLRRGPWASDPNAVPQERMFNDGMTEQLGWLGDGSVTTDVIAAGAVTADKIEANTITANEIAAGTITANEIATNTITSAQIASNAITADEIAANTITAAEIAANTITAAQIAADSITTSELAADAVITENILAANVTSSRMEVTLSGKNFSANSGSEGSPGYYFDSASTTGLYYGGTIPVVGTVLALGAGGSTAMNVGSVFVSPLKPVLPSPDNTHSLGGAANRWTTVYATNGTINTSDGRLKMDIQDAPLGLDFVRSLRPRVYRWRDTDDTQAKRVTLDAEAVARACAPLERRIERIRRDQITGIVSDEEGNQKIALLRDRLNEIRSQHERPVIEAQSKRRPGKRLHYGLIAQEVKAALDAAGVDSMDAAFWLEEPSGEQSLNYTELMIPLLRAVQELAARVEELDPPGPSAFVHQPVDEFVGD